MDRIRRKVAPLAVAAFSLALADPASAGSVTPNPAYDAAIAGAGFAAGDAIGAAAVSGQGGYDGGAPTGYSGGPGPADRPCFVRRPVFHSSGTMIGYRGVQLC